MNQFNVQFARLKKSAQKWIDAPLPASKTTNNSATVTPKKSPKNSEYKVMPMRARFDLAAKCLTLYHTDMC